MMTSMRIFRNLFLIGGLLLWSSPLFAAITSEFKPFALYVDKEINGLTLTKNATTSGKVYMGIASANPKADFVVKGRSKFNKGLAYTVVTNQPTGASGTIDWTKGSVQSLSVANTNLTITFSRPFNGVPAILSSKLYLVVNYVGSAEPTVTFLPTADIKWAGGSAFTKISGISTYLIQLSVTANASKVTYYGKY
jgi:hypothetical protein